MNRILKIRIINFESIGDATLEFDERNVIVLKGYNDSGKSAITQALRVLFYNWKPRSQVDFIQDDKEFFRILLYDSDGYILMRDKYRSGASLYTLYKDEMDDEHIVYSTKQEGVLINFDGVPDEIAKYLGVASAKNMYLNARDRNDTLLLAHTSGSENYTFLSEVLHSDELALASRLLNTDKNRKQAEIAELNTKLAIYRSEYNSLYHITERLVETVEGIDKDITDSEEKENRLINITNTYKELRGIVIPPELGVINTSRLKEINLILSHMNELKTETLPIISQIDIDRIVSVINIKSLIEELKKDILPALNTIDINRLNVLRSIISKMAEVRSDVFTTKLPTLEPDRLRRIATIVSILNKKKDIQKEIEDTEVRRVEINNILKRCNQEIKNRGVDVVECDNCGNLIVREVS